MILRALLLSLLFVLGSAAQGSLEDYGRAAKLRKAWQGKLQLAQFEPRWDADGFWYRSELGAGRHEYVRVTAPGGERQAAFDHQLLAKLLSKELGHKVEPRQLPLLDLQLHEGTWWLWPRGAAGAFSLSKSGKALESQAFADSPFLELERHKSSRGSQKRGAQTHIVFVNELKESVELFWTPSNKERRSYGKLAPGAVRVQHTFAGHGWLARTEKGQEYAFLPRPRPGLARITDARPSKKPAPQERSGRRSRPSRRSTPSRSQARAAKVVLREHDVWLQPVGRQEEPIRLTQVGKPGHAFEGPVRSSPDGRYAIVMRVERPERRKIPLVEVRPKGQLQPKLHMHDYVKPGDPITQHRPWLIDVHRRKAHELDTEHMPTPWRLSEFRWAEDSSRFTFVYNERGHRVMRILAVDPRRQRVSILLDEPIQTFFDYAYKCWLRWLPERNEFLWMTERSGWNHIHRFDAKTGKELGQVTSGEFCVRRVERLDTANGELWFWAGGHDPQQDPYHLHLGRVQLDGSQQRFVTKGDGTHTVRFSPDRRYLLDTWSRVDLPPRTALRSAEDGAELCIVQEANTSELTKADWRAPERFVAQGRDGKTEIWGIIHRPSKFDPGSRKYPVLEQIYAGPHGAARAQELRVWQGAHASSPSSASWWSRSTAWAPTGRSKAFHDVAWKNLGTPASPIASLWHAPRREHATPGWTSSASASTAPRPAARAPWPPCSSTTTSTTSPSPTAAATTTAWTRSGGTSSGWAGPIDESATPNQLQRRQRHGACRATSCSSVGEMDQQRRPGLYAAGRRRADRGRQGLRVHRHALGRPRRNRASLRQATHEGFLRASLDGAGAALAITPSEHRGLVSTTLSGWRLAVPRWRTLGELESLARCCLTPARWPHSTSGLAGLSSLRLGARAKTLGLRPPPRPSHAAFVRP
jgi:dipeptidyl-peptidase-4